MSDYPIGLKLNSLPASLTKIGSKLKALVCRHCFPHYKSMGAFCCHGNLSFQPICPKTLCNLSSTPMMLNIKWDQDWPTGLRDIQVQKCGRRTDRGSLVYYKLTLWAFSSGELKSQTSLLHEKVCLRNHLIGSPEPKVRIWTYSVARHLLSVVVVNIFKRHLLWSHQADSYQISHIASISWGNDYYVILFQSDKNSGCYGNL